VWVAQRFMAEVAATVRAREISVADLSAVEIQAAEIREASQAAQVPALELAAVADRIRASGESLPERARTLSRTILADGQTQLREFAWDVPRGRGLAPARCPLKPG
jgi:hypothetical protein